VSGYLSGKGYAVPPAVNAKLGEYVKAGMNLIACERGHQQGGAGGRRARAAGRHSLLSERPVRKLPSMLGLTNLDGKQDLFLYVVDPEKRYEAKTTRTFSLPPTSKSTTWSRNGPASSTTRSPTCFWPSTGRFPQRVRLAFAGLRTAVPQRDAADHELMSLGGDILDEKTVPEAERFPEPPEETEEEKEAFKEELKEMKPKDRKDAKKAREDERNELARRKALLARQKWMSLECTTVTTPRPW